MEKILLFNINIFKQNTICSLCKDLGIETAVVVREDFAKTIGQIAGMPETGKAGSHAGALVLFEEEMMVFCGLQPDRLDNFLKEYRKRQIQPIPLKAVMTPYNMQWTPGRLCMELGKEHEAFQK